jgi:hypothetical protein
MCESVDTGTGEEDLDRTLWRTPFGRDFGPVVRQTTQWIYDTLSRRFGKKSLFVFTIVTI